MTNLELALTIILTIILTTGSTFWLVYLVFAFGYLIKNKLMNRVTIQWPVFVFTPLSVGWMIYMGVTYL